MVPVLIATLLVAQPLPVLCVENRGDPPIESKDLILAIRARIGREQVKVETCGPSGATWRVIATFKKKDEVELALDGRDIDARRTLFIGGLARQEITQTIALTAVEVVRRPLDALLASMGLAPPPPVEDRCPDAPPPVPCPTCAEPTVCAEPPPPPLPLECPACAACADCPPPIEVPAAVHFGVGLELGPSISTTGVDGWIAVSGPVRFGPLAIVPHVGISPLGWLDETTQVFDFELGLVGVVKIDPVEVGVGLADRLHLVKVSGTANADGTQTVWEAGVLTSIAVDFLDLGPLTLGVVGRAWLWPEPPRFRIDGVVVAEEPHFEASVCPRITLRAF